MTGFILIALGAIYLLKPNIFQRGIWLKTSIAVRTMTPENYKIYMRILGGVFIALGLFLIAKENNIF